MTTAHQFGLLMIVFALFGAGAIALLLDDDALRDEGKGASRPYSFARVQLWWWSVIIMGSWILIYGMTQVLWKFDGYCLTLLGISSVTTAAARMIDGRAAEQAHSTLRVHEKSEGFLVDLLSDEQGPSIHRFQSLVFNGIYGLFFLIDVFNHKTAGGFPKLFDEYTLTLLGVSSGTYLTIKGMESGSPSPEAPSSVAAAAGSPASVNMRMTPRPGAATDELIDADLADGEESES